MKLRLVLISCFLCAISAVSAQEKSITLEDIWKNNTFRTERLQALHPMSNGKEYAVQNFDRAARLGTVDIYNYESGEKVRTAVLVTSLALKKSRCFYLQSFSLYTEDLRWGNIMCTIRFRES
jgi:hypothetical protein